MWEILRARPDTPVVACWIEGGWGSYFSFKGGPPTRNKRRDFRRPIDIGVSAPEVVPADVFGTGRLPPPGAGSIFWAATWKYQETKATDDREG